MMPAVINFSSVFFRTINTTLKETTKTIRINCTGSLTKEVREKMKWGDRAEPPEDAPEDYRTLEDAAMGIRLEGELHASEMELTPNEDGLKANTCKVDIKTVGDFQLVRVEEDGKAPRLELRFQIMTSSPGALARLERYFDKAGQAKANLRISYVKQLNLGEDESTEAAKA